MTLTTLGLLMQRALFRLQQTIWLVQSTILIRMTNGNHHIQSVNGLGHTRHICPLERFIARSPSPKPYLVTSRVRIIEAPIDESNLTISSYPPSRGFSSHSPDRHTLPHNIQCIIPVKRYYSRFSYEWQRCSELNAQARASSKRLIVISISLRSKEKGQRSDSRTMAIEGPIPRLYRRRDRRRCSKGAFQGHRAGCPGPQSHSSSCSSYERCPVNASESSHTVNRITSATERINAKDPNAFARCQTR